MKPMICKNCGGTINRARLICEYCGTKYEIESHTPLVIKTIQSPCDSLVIKVITPSEALKCMDEKELARYTEDRIARQFAKKIIPYCNIVTEYDPTLMEYVTSARLRVLHPDYGF